MEQIYYSEITIDELVKKVVAASTSKFLKEMERLINQRTTPEEPNKEITRKAASILLNVSPATLDKFTKEGLLTKYGCGKRARYLFHEVEEAKQRIRASLYQGGTHQQRRSVNLK